MSNARVTRGGLTRLVVYRTDTGAALSLRAVLVAARDGGAALQEDHETTPTAAGTTRTERVRRSMSALITEQNAIETLQAWRLAGARIRALSIGRASSAHRVWDEPVRVDLRPADAGISGLSGHLLTLATSRFAAAVALSDDLAALGGWADLDADGVADAWTLTVDGGNGLASPVFVGSGASAWQSLTAGAGETVTLYRDVVLPAPGLRVRLASVLTGGASGQLVLDDPGDDSAVTLRMEAYRFGPIGTGSAPLLAQEAEITAEGEGNLWFTLPAETHTLRLKVEIAGGTAGLGAVQVRRPRLLTSAESAGNVLAGGFVLDSEDGDSFTLSEFGSAWVDEATVTRTFLGTDYDVSVYTLGPSALTDLLVTEDEAEPHSFTLATTPSP